MKTRSNSGGRLLRSATVILAALACLTAVSGPALANPDGGVPPGSASFTATTFERTTVGLPPGAARPDYINASGCKTFTFG